MIKKLILGLAMAFGLLMPATALADNPLSGPCSNLPADKQNSSSICNQANGVDSTTQNPVAVTLKKVANILATIIGVVAVFMIIISGITFITSTGNSDAVTQSRNRIIYTVVGLIITAMAWSITTFFANHL